MIPVISIAGFTASVLYGTPARLPGVALGLPLLLHLERAAALLAVLAGVTVFAYMTSLGHLPSQLGNIGYSTVDRQRELDRQVIELRKEIETRFAPLEQGSQASDQAVLLIQSDLADLDHRLADLEAKADG
ncbi:MAG TPA: hypothetical protein VK272_13500 [Solirubrobacteraceae bacterium]|nr:hypothetical protein [Solirubrobacteraceae bacterium]